MTTFDNTTKGMALGDEGLNRKIAETQHDADYPHEKHYWMEELRNSDGDTVCTYRMWKTEPCSHPDCHHPIYSQMPF